METKLHLAQAYEAETERIREESGVAEARRRVERAKRRAINASEVVADLPTTNAADVLLKAEVIVGEFERRFADPGALGIVSDGYFLARAILAVNGRAAA